MPRIAVTGPESTGKTSLARFLSQSTGLALVPEYAREYLENKREAYTEEDLLAIARGQVRSESSLRGGDSKSTIITDTWLLVIKIWSEHKYGRCDKRILALLEENPVDVYLLCSPDLPWTPDPLRENPDKGQYFFNWFERELKTMKANYFIVKGIDEERRQNALLFVKEWQKEG